MLQCTVHTSGYGLEIHSLIHRDLISKGRRFPIGWRGWHQETPSGSESPTMSSNPITEKMVGGAVPGLKASMITPSPAADVSSPVLALIGISFRPLGTRKSHHAFAFKGSLHEFGKDRSSQLPPVLPLPMGRGIIKTDINAGNQVRCIADKPGILFIVGCSGLAGHGTSQFLHRSLPFRAGPHLPSWK